MMNINYTKHRFNFAKLDDENKLSWVRNCENIEVLSVN